MTKRRGSFVIGYLSFGLPWSLFIGGSLGILSPPHRVRVFGRDRGTLDQAPLGPRGDGVPVVVDSPLYLPRRDDEAYDTAFANAGKLAKAGVRVVFNEGGDDGSNVRNLPHLAATAVTFG